MDLNKLDPMDHMSNKVLRYLDTKHVNSTTNLKKKNQLYLYNYNKPKMKTLKYH